MFPLKSSRLLLLACALMCAHILPAQTFLTENFNSGIPATWTVVNGGNTTHTWTGTTGGYNGQYLDGSEFAFVNSDGAGNLPPVYMHEDLVSPFVNTSSASTLYLEFDHYFRGLGQTDSGHVEVWDGSAWNRIVSYRNTVGIFGLPNHVQLNVSAFIGPDFRVRFTYDDNSLWAWYWAVDNVQIYSPLVDDATVTTLLAPLTDGRALSIQALGASTPVSVTVRNVGLDTIPALPMYFQVDGLPAVGPEFLPFPLPPNQNANFTFTATANLSAVGLHHVQVWCGLGSDFNPSNDTLRFRRQQWPNQPILFPHCQSFEAAADTTVQTQIIGLEGVPEMDFITSRPNEGRLRTFAGSGFPHTGIRAITLDRSPTGSPNAVNHVIFTYNLNGIVAADDQVLLDLAMIEHGDEVQAGDSIWIRGCDTCTWLRVLGWNTTSGGVNGSYFFLNAYDLSARLLAGGQNFSTSFQIRVGQEDNFNAFGLIGNDGFSFDDLCLRRVFEYDAMPQAILQPLDGACGDSLSLVQVVVQNSGRDTLPALPISLHITGPTSASFSDTLQGPLIPGSIDTLTLGTINTLGGGAFQCTLITQLLSDEYNANDTLVQIIHLLGPPLLPNVADDTICAGDSVHLAVLQPAPGLEWYWYDSAQGGNLLSTGPLLDVGPVFAPTVFHVEARHIRRGELGAASNAIGNGTSHGVFADGLRFNAYRDFVLDSVYVYPGDTGWVHVNLSDSASVLVFKDSIYVRPAQAYQRMVIPIGRDVPMGIGHLLSASGTNAGLLWRNSTGASYPYAHADVATITSAINNQAGYYYFFYDWHISYPDCPGPRTPVQVDTASVPPQAVFASTASYLDAAFQNQSNFATTYHWDFGDGNVSQLANPQHTYALNGTYNVCLIAGNACGADTLCQSISVSCAPMSPGFSHFSNMLQGTFTDTTAGSVSQFWDFGDGSPLVVAPAAVHVFPNDSAYVVCLGTVNICQDTAFFCDTLKFCGVISCNFSSTVGPGGLTVSFTPFVIGQAVSYSWDFGDGNTSTLVNPVHTFSSGGLHVVTLTVTNLCGESAFNPNSLTLVGLEDGVSAAWQVWPNPVADQLLVDLGPLSVAGARFNMTDALGKQLHVAFRERGDGIYEADCSALPAGAYFLRVEMEGVHRDPIAIGFKVLKQP